MQVSAAAVVSKRFERRWRRVTMLSCGSTIDSYGAALLSAVSECAASCLSMACSKQTPQAGDETKRRWTT